MRGSHPLLCCNKSLFLSLARYRVMLLQPFLTLISPGQIGSQFVSNFPSRKLTFAMFFCAITLLASLPGLAVTRTVTHAKVHHVRHSVVRSSFTGHYQVGIGRWTPMFPGSHDMLVRQNEELDRLQ